MSNPEPIGLWLRLDELIAHWANGRRISVEGLPRDARLVRHAPDLLTNALNVVIESKDVRHPRGPVPLYLSVGVRAEEPDAFDEEDTLP